MQTMNAAMCFAVSRSPRWSLSWSAQTSAPPNKALQLTPNTRIQPNLVAFWQWAGVAASLAVSVLAAAERPIR